MPSVLAIFLEMPIAFDCNLWIMCCGCFRCWKIRLGAAKRWFKVVSKKAIYLPPIASFKKNWDSITLPQALVLMPNFPHQWRMFIYWFQNWKFIQDTAKNWIKVANSVQQIAMKIIIFLETTFMDVASTWHDFQQTRFIQESNIIWLTCCPKVQQTHGNFP